MSSSTLRFDHLQHQFEENPRRHFVPLANAFLRAGNAHRAVELCRTFLPQLPGHVSGHVVLAQALQSLGMADEARTEYERVLALDADNLVAVRALGDMATARGSTMEARGWYARLVELDPRDADAAARLDELTRDAAVPVAPPYHAVPGDALDERHREIVAEAAPFDDPAETSAEEFTAGFFASVLDDSSGGATRPDDRRFASDLDHLLPDAPLPGADELHATLSAAPAAPEAEQGRSLSSLSPLDGPAPGEPDDAPTPTFEATPFADDVLGGALEPFDATAPAKVADAPGAPDPFEPIEPSDPPAAAAPDDGAEAGRAERATPAATPIMAEFPEDAAAAADLLPEPGPAFVTETMAELYLRQGFRAEALDVYRQLLAASPDDARLRAVVDDLARPAAPTPDSSPAVVEPDDAFDGYHVHEVDDAQADVAAPVEPPGALDPVDAAAVPTDAGLHRIEDPRADDAPRPDPAPAPLADDRSAGDDRAEPSSSFPLGAGGIVDGVAGVDDAAWALGDAPGAAPSPAAPTVASWLSSLVAGEELPIAAAAPTAGDAAVEADAPAAELGDVAPAPVELAWTEPESAPPEPHEAPAAVEPEPTPLDLDEAASPAELAEAEAEPVAAWVEAEPEQVDDDDLALLLLDETADAADEEQLVVAASDAPAADAAPPEGVADRWPTWDSDAGFAEADRTTADAERGDADERAGAEFAGTIAAEAPLDDLEPVAAAGTDTAVSWDDPFAWDDAEPTPSAPAASAAGEPFSLDELFARPADPADVSAAGALAAATAGLGDDAATRALEATAAADGESLGALLRATPPGAPAAGDPVPPAAAPASMETPARGSSFSFEQFFRPTPAAGGPAAPPPRPAPEPAPERDDDLDEFHRWLEGLSKS